MKLIIYYFLNSDEINSYRIDTKNFTFYIYTGDLKNWRAHLCGRRAHTVYVDKEFNTRTYQDIIAEFIKPLANLQGGEGMFYI